MGEQSQQKIAYQEAVVDWYDCVYMPLVDIIRSQKILRDFPHRTEADLYLWIIEHRWYLQEEYHTPVSLEDATRHFSARFSPGVFSGFFSSVAERIRGILRR